jgi:hypothetical protein
MRLFWINAYWLSMAEGEGVTAQVTGPVGKLPGSIPAEVAPADQRAPNQA